MIETHLPPLAESLSLAGGLPVRLLRRQGPAILSARLAIRGGSSADPAGGRGAHQLLAGLMTRGCGELDAEALADLVEGAGAGLRAEALEDALVIGLKCAAADGASLLPLLLAMVRQPQLSSDQLDLERQLNLQTLQRQKEDPFQLAHDQLRHNLYGAGPSGHDPLGAEADLESLAAADLQPLVADLGQAGAVMVLSGAIPDDLTALLEQGLGGEPWPTLLPSAAAWSSRPSAPPAARLVQLEQDTEQLVLMLGCTTLPLGHPDAVALRLLQAHLGLGMSSRLFVTMREERGLAYDVGVHLPARCGAAPFVPIGPRKPPVVCCRNGSGCGNNHSIKLSWLWLWPNTAARTRWVGRPAPNWPSDWLWCSAMGCRPTMWSVALSRRCTCPPRRSARLPPPGSASHR